KSVTGITNPNSSDGGSVIDQAGDIVQYQIVVTATEADVAGVTVTDLLLQGAHGTLTSPTGDTSDPGVLNLGETWTFTGSYTVQQSDIDSNGTNEAEDELSLGA